MHDIEPYYQWRDYYIADEDPDSPFFGHQYSEFHFTNKVYNFYIHPQWDEIGSSTLYAKLIYTDYINETCVIELIGEWNDTLHNDIMLLKSRIIDHLIQKGINKFILIGENVLNFHASDDCYYEEWYEDIADEVGWVVMINFMPHVLEEMRKAQLHHFLLFGQRWNNINWRSYAPEDFCELINDMVERPKFLTEA